MSFKEMDLNSFAAELFSKNAVPGGGGASAVVGALGTALVGMVGNLTSGKAKYAEYESEMQEILSEAVALQNELLSLADKDAEAFLPLSKTYSLPKDTPNRDEIMEQCLKQAAAVPLEILRCACRGIKLHEQLENKCSVMAISDVATGVVFCWSALYGAAINVRVNTRLMKNRDYANTIDQEVEKLMNEHWQIADGIYERIWDRLK